MDAAADEKKPRFIKLTTLPSPFPVAPLFFDPVNNVVQGSPMPAAATPAATPAAAPAAPASSERARNALASVNLSGTDAASPSSRAMGLNNSTSLMSSFNTSSFDTGSRSYAPVEPTFLPAPLLPELRSAASPLAVSSPLVLVAAPGVVSGVVSGSPLPSRSPSLTGSYMASPSPAVRYVPANMSGASSPSPAAAPASPYAPRVLVSPTVTFDSFSQGSSVYSSAVGGGGGEEIFEVPQAAPAATYEYVDYVSAADSYVHIASPPRALAQQQQQHVPLPTYNSSSYRASSAAPPPVRVVLAQPQPQPQPQPMYYSTGRRASIGHGAGPLMGSTVVLAPPPQGGYGGWVQRPTIWW